MADSSNNIEATFNALVAYIKDKSNPKGKAPTVKQKLEMYGLFKRIRKGCAKGISHLVTVTYNLRVS